MYNLSLPTIICPSIFANEQLPSINYENISLISLYNALFSVAQVNFQIKYDFLSK